MFLSEFKPIQEDKSDTVTSTYVPNQIQQLQFGNLKKDKPIEYIGPSFHPKSIKSIVNGRTKKSDVHEFSFNNIYWLDRHWQCGSCPHLFFNQGVTLKYQGEIFNIEPNTIHTERITIPNHTLELIIAELEQEKTTLLQVTKNGIIVDTKIELEETEYYTIPVKPKDIIMIKGMYELKGDFHRKLPTTKKIDIVNRFKKTMPNN